MTETRTTLGEGGRLVIPAEYRRKLGVSPGDELIVIYEHGELRILTPAQALRRAQEQVRRYVPSDVSLVDELIADRQDESGGE